MTLTPDELRQVAFTVVMRGYDRAQVDGLLGQVETELTRLHGEVQRLSVENQRLAGVNEQLSLRAAEANRATPPLAGPLPAVPTASVDGSAATGHIAQHVGGSSADAMRRDQ